MLMGPTYGRISDGLLFHAEGTLSSKGEAYGIGPCIQTSNLEVLECPLGELLWCSWDGPPANKTPSEPRSLGTSVPQHS